MKLTLQEVELKLSKYNLKLVSEYMGVSKKHQILCYCGRVFECEIGAIFYGNTSSCGCSRMIDVKTIENRLLKTGIKLLEPYRGVEVKHLLLCHCGKEFVCLLRNVLRGTTKSCGCIGNGSKGIFQAKHPSWQGCGEIGLNYWNSIKRNASSRSLKFDITIEQVWDLFLKQKGLCAISGIKIGFGTNSRSGDKTASIDRIDSSKGYNIDNIQWIHKDVNKMKNNMSEDMLFRWCELIYKNKLQQINPI